MKDKEINMWKISTITLAILVVILLGNSIYEDYLFNKNLPLENRQVSFGERVCSMIESTPAWSNGTDVSYGYQSFGNQSLQVVSDLINQEIYFIYNPDCGYCQQQIKYYVTDWQVYKDSGYTINCKDVLEDE